MTLQLIAEVRSAAAPLRRPGGTTTDRISAELLERAAQTLAVLQRVPLPATTVTEFLPDMRDDWTPEIHGAWAIRAAERAHGIGPTSRTHRRPAGPRPRTATTTGRWTAMGAGSGSSAAVHRDIWQLRRMGLLRRHPRGAWAVLLPQMEGNARGKIGGCRWQIMKPRSPLLLRSLRATVGSMPTPVRSYWA